MDDPIEPSTRPVARGGRSCRGINRRTAVPSGSGPKLNVTEDAAGDEEGGEPENDNGSIEALTKELKGQRWDADKSVWK